jgi:hypothetical protein
MKKYLPLMIAVIVSVYTIGSSAEEKAKRKKGPAVTDYSSGGFKIVRVVKFKKEKNALGKMLDRDAKFEVGRAAEMDHDLSTANSGEEYLIRWKYSGDAAHDKVQLNFEFKLANRVEVQSAIRQYTELKAGNYKLSVKNIGKSFARGGKIQYWRATIETGGKVMAEMKSVSWDAFARERQAAEDKKIKGDS